jgi:hypothetical protein
VCVRVEAEEAAQLLQVQLRADLERSRRELGKAVEDKNTLLGEKISLERQVFEAEKMAWEVWPCGGGTWRPCGGGNWRWMAGGQGCLAA